MKKTIITLTIGLSIAVTASAQNLYDALQFSKNDYFGSARTLAMGNAFTALGGDLGSVGINPAGSAVAGYSQFTFSPGINIAVSKAGVVNTDDVVLSEISNTFPRASMPNVGFSLDYNLHNTSGVKSFTIGFVSNVTRSFNDETYAGASHFGTTFAGSIAAGASGCNWKDLDSPRAWENMPWDAVIGWKSGMIAVVGDKEDQYVGVTEKYTTAKDGSYDIFAAGPLEQSYGRMVYGNKSDYVINMGFNINDVLYIGANLGITSLSYKYNNYFKEVAKEPSDFEIDYGEAGVTCFNDLKYQYYYEASGSGIYGKIGFIYVPNEIIRFGGAIQTPTMTDINELWYSSASTHFSNSYFDSKANSENGEYCYRLSSPYRFNLGTAVNFGMGLFSVDYEMVDYSRMKFKPYESNDFGIYSDTNSEIRDYMGVSHNLRAGLEYKPLASVALRAGYGLVTSGERYYNDLGAKTVLKYYDHSFAVGAGYSSKGSFFADFALRALKQHDEYIYPYDEYIFDDKGQAVPTPEFLNRGMLWTAVCTLGFRF